MDTPVTTDSVDEVQQFAVRQLRWLARRGSRDQRRAARAFANMMPRLVDPVRQALTPADDHNPAA